MISIYSPSLQPMFSLLTILPIGSFAIKDYIVYEYFRMNQRVHRELMEFHSINSYCYFCFIDSNHLILKVQFFLFFFYCYSFESKLRRSVLVVLTPKYDDEVAFNHVYVHCFLIHFSHHC